jgi:MFS family permease
VNGSTTADLTPVAAPEEPGHTTLTAVGVAIGALKRRLLFVVILCGGLAASMVYVALAPILPQLAVHFGGGEAGKLTAQLGMSMPGVGIMIGGLLSGWLVARMGLRWLMLASIVGFGLLGVAGGLFGNLWVFSATRFLLGFAGAGWTTACVATIAEIYDERGRLTMIGYWKASMALSAGPIVFAAGSAAKAFGWPAAFGLYAALALPALLLGLVVVPRIQQANIAAPTAEAGAREPGLWRLWPIFVMIFFLHVMMMMGNNQIPFVLAKWLHSPDKIALAMLFISPASGVAALVSGFMQVRFGERRMLMLAIAAVGVGCVLIGLSQGVALAVVGAALMGVGTGTYLPIYMTLPLSRVSAAGRSAAIGMVQFAMYFGAFMNPFLLAPLDHAVGPTGTYLVIGVLALIAVGIAVIRIVLQGKPPVPAAA